MKKTLMVLAIVACVVAPVWAGAPTDQVREYSNQVLKVLEDPNLKPQERRAAVRKIAIEIFDVTETARRALGPHWQARTSAEREEFVQLFADLLERTYIARIDEYGGERIRYVGETVEGDYATVRARIITKKGNEVPAESRMIRQGERWLIYDVSLENVSLINNYRSQFDRIIRTSSYGELIKRMREKRESPEPPPVRRAS